MSADKHRLYRLTYDAGGDRTVVWLKSAADLLTPNGTESLLDFMFRQSDERGTPITLETVEVDEDGWEKVVR
jgi:hypothetical protein